MSSSFLLHTFKLMIENSSYLDPFTFFTSGVSLRVPFSRPDFVFFMSSGVPQGCYIGPFLFTMEKNGIISFSVVNHHIRQL